MTSTEISPSVNSNVNGNAPPLGFFEKTFYDTAKNTFFVGCLFGCLCGIYKITLDRRYQPWPFLPVIIASSLQIMASSMAADLVDQAEIVAKSWLRKITGSESHSNGLTRHYWKVIKTLEGITKRIDLLYSSIFCIRTLEQLNSPATGGPGSGYNPFEEVRTIFILTLRSLNLIKARTTFLGANLLLRCAGVPLGGAMFQSVIFFLQTCDNLNKLLDESIKEMNALAEDQNNPLVPDAST